MSNPRGPGWSDPAPSDYPPNTDPAYGQYPGQYWGPPYYGPGYSAPLTQPTEQLPAYWQPGGGYPPAEPPSPPPPPPQPPKSPRWLWVAAIAALLLVAGLVAALISVTNSSRESRVVAPPTTPTTTPRLTTPTRVPTIPSIPSATPRMPLPTETAEPPIPLPDETTDPSVTESVVYNVTGQGRAINITYVDTGGIMQTEFNVALPWSKEVRLALPAKRTASVAVVNVGRQVTCSVTVNGAQVRQRTGQGLTICTGVA